VFENKMLRRIFGHERDEATRGLRKLQLQFAFFSSYFRVIKSRRIK
jgi:hypothetical protein